ncbi:unnamed protein product, partial [Ixodes pacificus]
SGNTLPRSFLHRCRLVQVNRTSPVRLCLFQGPDPVPPGRPVAARAGSVPAHLPGPAAQRDHPPHHRQGADQGGWVSTAHRAESHVARLRPGALVVPAQEPAGTQAGHPHTPGHPGPKLQFVPLSGDGEHGDARVAAAHQ